MTLGRGLGEIGHQENRLVVAKDTGNGQSTYFLYDYQGDRTIKRGQGGETLYVNEYYQLQNQDIITKHIFVGNTRMVSKLTHYDHDDKTFEKQNIYTYHPDHLGSSNFVSDYAGNEFEHMEYTPYGESWVDEGTNKNVIGYRFTGKELDDETGLYYFGARYLDPLTSRWMSPDPALEKYLPEPPVDKEALQRNRQLPGQGGVFNPVNLNGYCYAGNNPIRYADPDGKAYEASATWGSTMWWLCAVDGPIPAGDIIYAGGEIVIAAADTWTLFGDKLLNMFQAAVNNSGSAQKGAETGSKGGSGNQQNNPNRNQGFKDQLSKMGQKSLEKTQKSLQQRIQEHEEKIANDPKSTAVKHWQHEIRVWKGQLEAVKDELAKRTVAEATNK